MWAMQESAHGASCRVFVSLLPLLSILIPTVGLQTAAIAVPLMASSSDPSSQAENKVKT